MQRLGLSLVLLSAAMLLPTGAAAQVVVDPDSPAGKEYAIPLQQKRDKAAGGKDGGDSPAFGEGISKPGSKRGDGASGGNSSRDAKGKDKGKDDDSDDFDTTGAIAGDSTGGGGGSGGGPDEAGANGALLTSGIALAVLLLGGGIAFLMRRGAFGTDA